MRPQPCPWCGAPLQLVHVHGHGQCARCGTNVDPCCSGASAADEADEPPPRGAQLDPELLPRLFRELGGADATLARDCLELAIARALQIDLDAAREVLAAAAHLALVAVAGSTVRLARGASPAPPP